MDKKILLITGSPRSGTTVLGDMLSLGRGAGSLYEPLNFHVGCREVERYFEFPGEDGFSLDDLDQLVAGIRTLRLSFKRGGFPADRGINRTFKRLFGGRPHVTYLSCKLNPFLDTIVWKDPFAAFLCGLLAQRHGIDSLVTVRSPWAVAGSFKRLGWSFDLERIARGAAGLGFDVERFRSLLPGGRDDKVKNAVLLWGMLYSAVLEAGKGSEKIGLVDLDRVVAEPLPYYQMLYRRAGLRWSPRVARRIGRFYAASGSRSSVPRAGVAHDWKRDFSQVNQYYRRILSETEIAYVAEVTGDLWERVRGECL